MQIYMISVNQPLLHMHIMSERVEVITMSWQGGKFSIIEYHVDRVRLFHQIKKTFDPIGPSSVIYNSALYKWLKRPYCMGSKCLVDLGTVYHMLYIRLRISPLPCIMNINERVFCKTMWQIRIMQHVPSWSMTDSPLQQNIL